MPPHTQLVRRRAPRGCLHIQSMQSFQGSGAACDSIPGRSRAVMGWESLELQTSVVLGVFGCAAWEWVRGHPHESIPETSRMHSPALASLYFKTGPHHGATVPAAPATTLLLGQGNSPQWGQTGTWPPRCPPGKLLLALGTSRVLLRLGSGKGRHLAPLPPDLIS